MDLFKKKTSGNVAKDRLKLVLVSDRANLPVAKAEELADGASSDLDIISSVYNYIITHFTYDYSKASSVTSGYLPDTDEVFTAEKGICFDYAAVMTFLMIAVILVLMQKSYLFFPNFMPNSEAS